MKDGLRINKVKYNKQVIEKPELSAGGVDFYSGASVKPEILEQEVFMNAVTKGEELVVKPEQACVVTRILEAIYESGKTGKPVYFD